MVAACFYSPEDYERLLKISDDKNLMCATYTEWLVQFMKMMSELEKQQVFVTPLQINIDDLIKYFEERKLKNTGKTRLQYASYLASKMGNTVLKEIENISQVITVNHLN